MHWDMEIGISYVYGYGPFLASDGCSNGRLCFHFEVKIPCLLLNQEQPAMEPERCFVQNPLNGSLVQQDIQGLLENLAAVLGVERDAVMGELRSMLKV